jgi:hypothetical protein
MKLLSEKDTTRGLFKNLSIVVMGFLLLFICASLVSAQSDVSVPTGKYRGDYYNDSNLSSFEYSEETNQINFNWGNGSPSDSIGVNNFSVRWRGNFFFEEGNYEFTARADDGIRVFVDNNILLDRWVHQLSVVQKARTNVLQGAHQIKVEYYESSGGASVYLAWERIGDIRSNGNSNQIINNSDDLISEVECIRLDASPQEGTVPLTVSFSAVFEDPKSQVIEYEFAFGETLDGEAQIVKQNLPNSSYVYNTVGYFTASVQAKDNLGNLIGGRGGLCEVTINVQEKSLTNDENNEEEDKEEEPDILVANDANELPDTGAFDYLLLGLSAIYLVIGLYLYRRFGLVVGQQATSDRFKVNNSVKQ